MIHHMAGLFKVFEIESAKYACFFSRTLEGRFLSLILDDIVRIQDTDISVEACLCSVLLIILSPASSTQDCAIHLFG